MKNSYLTVTDQFCGAGGSSIGATKAGAEVKLAMNHWKLAIETHNTNFPNTDHDCTDISAVDPRRYASTDILITSPECTNHSLAKGKPRRFYERDLFGNVFIDPAAERSRATMWDVPRFAEYHKYNIIITENVVDAAKWVLFEPWLQAMHALDYEHEIVYFNSMFAHPTPQSRDRMYVVFWKRGNRRPSLDYKLPAYCVNCGKNVASIQTWKKRLKWGRYKAQYFYRCPECTGQVTPYYFAGFNAIDWSIPAERIGDRKRPLKPKTLARIQYGLEKYGRQVMIVTGRYTSGIECRVKDATQEPIPTQPADQSHAVIYPWMVDLAHAHSENPHSYGGLEPYPTATSAQSVGVVAGFLSKQYGGFADPKNMAIGLSDPTGTVTTWDHHALLSLPGNMIVSVNDFDPRVLPMDRALGTQTTQEKWAVTAPAFIGDMRGTSKASPMSDPLMCVTANGNHHALLQADAFLSYYYGSHGASGAGDPIGTVTGLDRVGLVQDLDNMTVDDLTFRMLVPHEVGAAMAFSRDYKVLGTGRDQVKQYGNAVTPPAMEMLIRSCAETLR